MRISNTSAAIDNDFINHLIASNLSDEKLWSLLNVIFRELNLAVIIHPLVYQKEVLTESPRVKTIFENKIIQNVDFSDIFEGNCDRINYYLYLVSEFYGYLNDEDMPVSGMKILSFWKKGKSLGESHSLAMCLVTECGLFLSDDEDSQRLRKYIYRNSLGKIRVYDRKRLIDEHLAKGATQIERSERRALTHAR